MPDRSPSPEPEPFVETLNRPDVALDARLREAEAAAAEALACDWRPTVRRRLAVVAVLVACWIGAIEARLVYLQVVNHDEMVRLAERQHNRAITVPGKRGDLVDREGRLLAYSVDGDAIWADPSRVADAETTARAVCEAVDGCTPADRQVMEERLRRQRAFAYLWRTASPSDAQRVEALDLPGVAVHKEDRRYYPNREMAAHLLGYVGTDNTGLAGIEARYDAEITGRPGVMFVVTDARERVFSRIEQPPTTGTTLELTIDQSLQHIAERELEWGVAAYGARGGTVIVQEPRTGEVLALANWPRFNPNAFRGTEPERLRNRAVQEVYEPGSTFKLVTASAAIEEGLFRLDESIDVSNGLIRFGSRVIHDVKRYDTLSFTDVMVKSSNVGAIRVGLRLGNVRLGHYVRQFGFGQSIARDLPGESRGILWAPEQWSDSALASVSMGYQIGVTPIQMVTATSAVANGGELVVPRVVRARRAAGQRIEEPRTVIRRAITPQTASSLTAIMTEVVERGTAKAAQVPGYSVAGKTGTAAKLVGGRYSKTDYNASFIGFLPASRPAVSILVVIDTPRGGSIYGGAVAAPVFKRVAEATMRHLGIAPDRLPSPRVVVTERRAPPALVATTPARAPSFIVAAAGRPAGRGLMPDLRGLSAREAVHVLARLGIAVDLEGDGLVVDQDLEPGTPIDRGGRCRLRLARRIVADLPGDVR
ncbi:MAG: transpeptidase family protein [Acidobacteria bacterium]|nr:transpeptidase family protein [Acidobacteriota bacterium]